VRLEAKGFETYRQTIRIRSARPHTMVVPLEMPTQSASATGASVSKSAPGSASRIPFDSESGSADAPIGSSIGAAAQRIGALIVKTQPTGARVIIDGRDTGLVTPILKPYSVTAGEHLITFILPGDRSFDFKVEVPPGGPVRVDQSLE
ncbi:MAG: PEGA domain-containing protein, partial [Myxococcota bacterium]